MISDSGAQMGGGVYCTLCIAVVLFPLLIYQDLMVSFVSRSICM